MLTAMKQQVKLLGLYIAAVQRQKKYGMNL